MKLNSMEMSRKQIIAFMLALIMTTGATLMDGIVTIGYATSYTITITDGIANGTVLADKTTANEGETVTLTISPANLYELDDLSVKCGGTAVSFYWGTKSFIMPAGNVTVNASFKKKTTYTTFFKYSDKTFNKTTPAGESSTFALTEVLNGLEISTGTISNVEINGTCVTASQQDNQWLLTTHYGGDSFAPTATLNVTVDSTLYTINVSASQDSIPVVVIGSVRFDSNGGSGTMDAMNGRSDMLFVLPECSFTPPDGMVFDTWKIGSDYYPAGTTYRWRESVIAYAQWKDIEGVHSTLVSNSDPSKGSLVVSPTKALQNTTITLTPRPANGYTVDSISYSYEGNSNLLPTDNPDGTYSFSMPDKDVTVTIKFKADTVVTIPYLDANGNNANCTSNVYVSESDTTWNSGWYVVNQTLTNNNRIIVNGNVNLILVDGTTLNAKSGITVSGSNTLNIYAQSTGNNKGKLYANASQKPNCAAIGGENSEGTMNCGTINIYGGYVEAHGGQNSAGIGGGNVSAYNGGSGGTITIKAGTVKAYGGNWYGAGIGGGRHGNGGTIRINGGNIEAFGNYGAAGIGGGLDGQSGNITITGGTVLAKGSICDGYTPEWGAGIGSGRDAEANKIEITGGNVTAYGASNSAAIGSGRNFKCNEIIISGGVVNAIAYSTNDVGIGSSRSSTSTGTISLSWTDYYNDAITSNSYKGTVTLQKAFADKSNSTVTFAAGQVSDNSSISGKTIIPSDSSQHYHRFTYALSDDGTTITATCGGAGTCGLTSNPTLTIAAPTSLTYDGTAKAATVTGDTAVLGTPSIVYTKNGAAFTGTPTEPGVYTASITLGTATASVTYEIQSVKYNITISNANTGGTVTPDKTQAAFGETVTLTISPAPGYELDTLTAAKTDDSTTTVAVSGTGNTRTFTMPAYPVTVSATFSQIDYTITKATMTNGGVTVKVGETEAASAHYGDTVTLIPAPATDCALSSLTVCKTGDESTTVSVANNQFTMPAYPVTVSATFSLISITGISLSSSTITMTYGDAATSLAATVSPETALNTKVKFSVSSGADKIKLYKDESCTQEIGASDEFSSGTSIYVKPLASGTATITAVSVGDATKTASCAVTINKATPNLSGTLSCSATYGDTMAAVKIWLDNQSPLGVDGAELSGSWAWVDTTVQDSDPVGNVGNHSYQARFTPTDSNYNSITKTVEVIVDPKSLSPDDVDVSFGADEFTYNGTQQAPTVTAATLTGNDYTISYKKKTDENTWEAVSETTDAGNYKAVVTGQGNYTGTVEKEFTINRCAVTVSVDDKTVEYNGSEQSGNTAYTFSNVVNGHTASITYTPAKGTLPSDTAYDNGSYGDDFQVMAGQQDVTANYTLATKTAGKLTINNRAEKYEITVKANSNIGVYDGTEKTASGFVTSTFTVDGNTYEVSGLSTSNPKSTAVCSLTNTITGKAEVKDANGNDVTAQFNVILTNGSLEITPKSITGATVTLNQTQLGYTSSEQTVAVTGVAIDGLTLTENDYDVTGNKGTNAANYTVTVTGKGNFKDTATAEWKIVEAGMTLSAPDVSATYDGQAHGVAVTVTEPKGAAIKFKDEAGAYTLDASPAITNAGKLVVGYQITADNYTPVTGSATVTIAPKAATVTASAQTVKEGESIQTGTAWATLTDALSGHTLGAVTLTAENGKIVPSAAKIQDAKGNDVTGNYAVSYQPGALTALGKISHTVTFKVVNGSWDNGSAETKTVTLTGFAGDTLKLAAADIPAVGTKPGDNFKAGAWDVTPSAEAEVLADTTYTYTYADKDAISQTVTFKVANGSWDDGTTADKVVTLNGLEGETLKLAANQIPTVGTKPNGAFKAGSWDVTPDTETAITQDATYTYTYALRDAYLVTVTNDGNGTGSASPNSGYEGTEVTLTAYPAQGYKFKEWQVVSGGVTVTDNKFKLGTENVEVKAVFEAQATGWHKGEAQTLPGAPEILCSNMQEVVESIIAAIKNGEMKGISEEVRQAVSQPDAQVLVLFISAPLSPDQIPAEDWAALQKLQEEAGYTGIVPFDITLMLNVNGQDVAEVHETKIPVKFSVGIMENLLDKTRQFALANVHNGAAKVLPTTRRGNFLDGESTEFSTYAIAYKDEETSTDTPATTSTPAPVIDPTKFDDVAVPSGSFTFKKVWQGDSEKSIDFTLYRQSGTVYHHGFDKKVVSDKEWQYDAWFSAPAACYVIEKPIPGYQTKYVNVGVYAQVTDRCCDGGTIINKKIPKTGDSAPLALWAGMVALGAVGLTAVLVIGKKRKARK